MTPEELEREIEREMWETSGLFKRARVLVPKMAALPEAEFEAKLQAIRNAYRQLPNGSTAMRAKNLVKSDLEDVVFQMVRENCWQAKIPTQLFAEGIAHGLIKEKYDDDWEQTVYEFRGCWLFPETPGRKIADW